MIDLLNVVIFNDLEWTLNSDFKNMLLFDVEYLKSSHSCASAFDSSHH